MAEEGVHESMTALGVALDAATEQRCQALGERDYLNVACAELRQRYTPEDLQRQIEKLTRERDTAVQAAERAQALLRASITAIGTAIDELRKGCRTLPAGSLSAWRRRWT